MQLVTLLRVPKWDQTRNQPKDSVGSGGGGLRRDTNEGNGDERGEQAMAIATRAMAMAMAMATATAIAMAMAMTWVMATTMRLAGDKEGKDKGCKGNGDGDEGCR